MGREGGEEFASSEGVGVGKHGDLDEMMIIPTIDMGEFPGENWKLREACEEWGCFRVVNHKIPLTLMQEMKVLVRWLLDLPTEVKQRNKDVIAGSGYMAPSQVNPLYEALGLYDIGSISAVDAFCSQLEASPSQRSVVRQYAEAIHELAVELAQKMAESMGFSRGGDVFKEWACQFRINKYNFTQETVGTSGVQIHTDSGFLTILQEDENVGGLEVMHTRSGKYVPIDPVPGTLLVNLGDIATVWSNGRWCNVKHRVECKEAGIRITIATFLLGPKEGVVEAPQEMVDSSQPPARLYVPFTYKDFRKLRVSSKTQAGETLNLLRNPLLDSATK